MVKIASIGECMVEMLDTGDGTYRRGHAGDTFNMAQYAAWLSAARGMTVSYVTVTGKDRFGRAMREAWAQNGIDTSLVKTSPDKNTGLYFADTDAQGNRDYTFYRSDSAARQLFSQYTPDALAAVLAGYALVYFSAITLMILPDREKLAETLRALKSSGVKIAFDTNYRKSGWASPAAAASAMTAFMPLCDIVLPTFDENLIVFGDKTPADTVARIADLGVGEIAVKCGPEKCIVFADGSIREVPAVAGVDVVDTTSAGDSFNGAYIVSRLAGKTPEQAAAAGHKVAAEVIRHRGALIPRELLPDIFSL